MKLSPRRLALFVLAAAPYAALPYAQARSVEALARAGAYLCRWLLAAEAAGRPPPLDSGAAQTGYGESMFDGHRGVASSMQDSEPGTSAGHLTEEDSDRISGSSSPSTLPTLPVRAAHASRGAPKAVAKSRGRASIFVGADSVRRAIPAAGRPTSVWIDRTPQHPAGLVIQSPGALAGVIEPGDILFEAEGQTLASFEQLIVTVKQAYERRAARLSGRVFRRGDLVPVTVEPGW